MEIGETPEGGPRMHPAMWEERYASRPDDWFFGRQPSAIGRLAAHFWRVCHGDRRSRVLDLGCGEGRDAVYLASQGHAVTAVDIAPTGVEKTRRLARECGVALEEVRCADLRECCLTAGYDLIFAGNSLSALGEECLPFLRRIREATPASGLNAIRVQTREGWGGEERPEFYRFDRNELKIEYRGWRLFFYGEDLVYLPFMDRLGSFADIIAQKA